MSSEITTTPAGQGSRLDVFGSGFEQAQRMAKAISTASTVPPAYAATNKDGHPNQAAVANCLVALEISGRIGMGVFEVMQNMDLVMGRPSWKSEYVLTIIKTYGAVEYVWGVDGKVTPPGGTLTDNKTLFIRVTTPDGTVISGDQPVSYKLAIDDGWWTRKGSKWPAMPIQMLIYRAAAFWYRQHGRGELMGMRPADEVEDIAITEAPAKPAPAAGVSVSSLIGNRAAAVPETPFEVVSADAAEIDPAEIDPFADNDDSPFNP